MLRKLWVAGVFIVVMVGIATAAGDVMFSYKFKPGATEKYRLKINTEMEMSGMGMSQIADMTVTVTCQSVAEGMHDMTLTFDKVETSNVIGGNMQADPSAAKMIGKTVMFKVDPHGAVTEITPAADFAAWSEVQQAVEPTLKNWYIYMPDKAVAVGGEWKRENYHDASASGSEYTSTEHFKFREMKNEKGTDVAVVDENVTTKVGGQTDTPMGSFDLSGTGKGKFEFYFNPATGTITRFKGQMDTDIDMTPQSGGDSMKTSVSNHIERQLIE